MSKSKLLISIEVVNFEAEMKRIEQEVLGLAGKDLNTKIDFAAEQLAIVTPVDTGEARAGWGVKHSRLDRKGLAVGELINEVEHIEFLNDGHSKQAPKLFIEQVLSTIGLLTED